MGTTGIVLFGGQLLDASSDSSTRPQCTVSSPLVANEVLHEKGRATEACRAESDCLNPATCYGMVPLHDETASSA